MYARSVTLRYLVPLLAWLVAIFAISSIPNAHGAGEAGAGGPGTTSQLAHVIEYGVLSFLAIRCARAWFPRRRLVLLLAASWLFAVAYGISDEIHQSFVPRREASVDDVLLDAVGAVLGIVLWVGWQSLQRQRTMQTA